MVLWCRFSRYLLHFPIFRGYVTTFSPLLAELHCVKVQFIKRDIYFGWSSDLGKIPTEGGKKKNTKMSSASLIITFEFCTFGRGVLKLQRHMFQHRFKLINWGNIYKEYAVRFVNL